ncbi:MAG: two-component system response regulator [Porticoccaceae bacterium]|nr:two-component system response regulator [Porticoccaceae bacterium]
MTDADYLIVDDDAVFARTLARSLERRGSAVVIAETGEQALEQCRAASPARVILDLKLSSESGLQLIESIHALCPSTLIVVLTGYSSIPTTVQAIKRGALNYLCKPATLNEILQAFSHAPGHTSTPVPDSPHSVERLEWEHIQRVLNEQQGNISATARALGMHRRTLQRKLQKRPVKS